MAKQLLTRKEVQELLGELGHKVSFSRLEHWASREWQSRPGIPQLRPIKMPNGRVRYYKKDVLRYAKKYFGA